jgi:hypothetical protein
MDLSHNTRRNFSGASKEALLVDAILREGIWFPPTLLDSLPLLRPYAIRDNSCRGRQGGDDEWGLPNSEGFFRDDNSLIKQMPCAFPVVGVDHPYHGRKIGNGFVASHAWRGIHEGTSHGNPLTYSFVGNIVWLPSDLAKYTDEEGDIGQNILKAISWDLFGKFPARTRANALLEEIWACLPAPDTSVLPTNRASRISHFAVDMQRFTYTNHGLMKVLLRALAIVEQKRTSAVLNKIQFEKRSLSRRYSDNLPSKFESSNGFLKLKRVLNSAIEWQR